MISRTARRLLLAAAGFAVTLVPRAAAAAEPADTAGALLMKVWTQARRKYSDAMFMSVSARADASGVPECDARDPFRNGWRYTFYSPKTEKFIMMAECSGAIVGPLVQMRDSGASTLSIEGKFVDSDAAMRVLERSGVSLDPAEHNIRSRRPFLLRLNRLEDDRFKTHPVVWKIGLGKKSYLVDAAKNELFDPMSYGVSIDLDGPTEEEAAAALAKRPKRGDIYTARRDYKKVLGYMENKHKDASLMGIEGFSDAWGGSPCTGAGDGWAYYFYNPGTRGFEAIYACNGVIGPGPSSRIPIDLNQHAAITQPFVDSSDILDAMLINSPSIMHEGMGRNYTRKATLLLRQFRASPAKKADQWNVRLVWRATLGRKVFLFEAKSGKLLEVSQ